MEHCRDDTLALLALGEPVGSTHVSQHLIVCPPCRSRLDDLTRTVAVARSVAIGDRLVLPPAELWNSIAAELYDELLPHTARLGRRVRWMRSTQRARLPWILATALAALILGASGSALLRDADPGGELIASAQLAPVGIIDAKGTALLTSTTTGQRLSIDVPGLIPGPGYYEVWMATPDSTTMLAIGALGADLHGDFSLPHGVSSATYPIVDVSYEQVDGNPAHSLVSVVRGTLTS
jgi:hypothetical protein